MGPYGYGDPFTEWDEANAANADGEAVLAAELAGADQPEPEPGQAAAYLPDRVGRKPGGPR